MSDPNSDIKLAFQGRLATFPTLPVHPQGVAVNGFPQNVAWPRKKFIPASGMIYLAPYLLVGRPSQPEIGATAQNRYVGYYQISVFYPPVMDNPAALDTIVKALCGWFKRDTALSYGDASFKVTEAPEVHPDQTETDWIHVAISIQFRCDASN